MAELTILCLHPEMDRFDHGHPVQPFPSPFHYWRIPGGQGIILHTFFAPMLPLIDFAVVPPNHADSLEIDMAMDYVSNNFTHRDRIGIVQDSDEWVCISLTPRAVNWAPRTQTRLRATALMTRLGWLASMRQSMQAFASTNAEGDLIRRDLFRTPIRWHSGDLDEAWADEEQRILRLIRQAVGDYYVSEPWPYRDKLLAILTTDFLFSLPSIRRRLLRSMQGNVRHLRELHRRLWLAISGNDAARRWIAWRINVLWRKLRGHTAHPPRPEVP
jgi:hypothetical protein